MPTITLNDNEVALKAGQRFILILGTLQVKKLNRRNHKRPTRYKGNRKQTAVVLQVAYGRGQRRA